MKMVVLLINLLTIFVASQIARSDAGGLTDVKWSDCGSTQAVVHSVKVNCSLTGSACTVKEGTTVQTVVNFTTKSKNLIKPVTASVGSVIPLFGLITFPVADPCRSALTCPLVGGKTYTYTGTVYFKPMPLVPLPVNVDAVAKMTDSAGNTIICISVPVQGVRTASGWPWSG